MLLRPNPSHVPLQASAEDPDGNPRTDITTATVRVYYVESNGTETDVLASTAMAQAGSTNLWRYVWQPSSLAVNTYTAFYTMEDNDGLVGYKTETIDVHDLALQTDLEIVKKVETGRWKIIDNQMIFYEEDGQTALLTFNLFNYSGVPDNNNIYERDPV